MEEVSNNITPPQQPTIPSNGNGNRNKWILLIGIVTLLMIVGILFLTLRDKNQPSVTSAPIETTQKTAMSEQAQVQQPSVTASEGWPKESTVKWENTAEGGWLALDGTPPKCPEPLMFTPPTNITKATSLLYPGQERRGEKFMGKGGNYKPHGGFRFDGLKYNDVQVVAPFDGYVYRGSRFLQDGEIQYSFDIVNPCGVMVRLGHLRELSPAFQKIADAFPPAQELDSRTERVTSYPKISAGEIIATGVGFKNTQNIAFDWGVYDLRKANDASKNPAYKQAHADASELAFYAVCWLDMIPPADAAFIKNLPPGDPVNGKNSDYCK